MGSRQTDVSHTQNYTPASMASSECLLSTMTNTSTRVNELKVLLPKAAAGCKARKKRTDFYNDPLA